MDFQDKRYVIGIDLGTTNSAVSYADISLIKDKENLSNKIEKKDIIKIFQVPQLTGQGEFSKVSVLPSFLYIPGEYDISKEALKHAWKKSQDSFVGVFARDHGSKIPSRLVSSAKSWLCNPMADREAKILPWGSQGFEKVSPVKATAEFLQHVKNAWNHFVKDEDSFLENQFVVITVPASFNEEARDLTQKATAMAGFGSAVTLLEEPLAAFYSWLVKNENNWQKNVKPHDLILVCDVGGGTTDFSLITVKESEDKGSPRFERLAVGDHLILGGDNIDLALAKVVEKKFKGNTNLTSDKWKTLCHSCRAAKERILEKGEPSVRITIKGEGRSLIAGTLAADLTKDDLENVLNNQFFSGVEPEKNFQDDQGKQIADFGLPFEKDPSITRHIIRFLEKHRESVNKHLGKDPIPDFILFNGGSLKPAIIQENIKTSLRNWFKIKEPDYLKILENNIPDLAVGVGASYYGLVKQGIGVRVGSGSPRSYYLGIGSDQRREKKAVCVVERGLDEGSEIELPKMEFEVKANEPVSFDIFSSSFRSGDLPGSIINIDESVTLMSPMQTVIKFGKKGEKKTIPVKIKAEYTEMGTLAMWCISSASDHKWKLQFQLRHHKVVGNQDTEVFDESLIKEACMLIDKAFSKNMAKDPILAGVVKKIETIVEKKKARWPLSFLRGLADKLLEIKEHRVFSPEHEVRWLNLTGFCVRPGFGDAFDEERIRKLWKIYVSDMKHPKQQQNRIEWWIFIRRIAGGLKAGQQRQFFQNIQSILVAGKNNKTKMSPQEYIELWMTAGNMERLLIKDKVVLGKALLQQMSAGKTTKQFCWVLSRLGARNLLYGSIDRVVPEKEIANWFNKLFKIKYKDSQAATTMIALMARKTGDRTRDIDEAKIPMIIDWMTKNKANVHNLKIIRERVDSEIKEQSLQFGESLPAGLVLKSAK